VNDTLRRALLRGIAASVVTFIVGSGAVFAMQRIGQGDTEAPPSQPGPSEPPNDPGPAKATTPEAHLVWVPGGFPDGFGEELTTLRLVKQAAVATSGVGWLQRSFEADGDQVDAPASPFMVPLDTTGIDTNTFASFLPRGPQRRLVLALQPGQAILSEAAAALRGLGEGATLGFAPDLDVTVVGTLPDVVMGAHEVLLPRTTAERIGVSIPRYALLRVRGQPTEIELAEALTELAARHTRQALLEVRLPGETRYLRAHDGSVPPITLKRRFGEFTAYPNPQEQDDLDLDPAWVEQNIETREIPRLGSVQCHRKTLSVLTKAMAEMSAAVSLGTIGACFDDTWAPDMRRGTLPAALWGASIRLNVSLNVPGQPPLIDGRIVETMTAWGFRWAGNDVYPDGALFEFLQAPSRDDGASPATAPDETSPSPADEE